MDKICIHINRLGPVSDADIVLNRFILFSGESGIGKSYMAMICHYMYVLLQSSSRLNGFFTQNGYAFSPLPDAYEKKEILSFTKKELEEWIAEDAVDYIQFLIGSELLDAEVVVSLPNSIPADITYLYRKSDITIDKEAMVNHTVFVDGVQLSFSDINLAESPYSILLRSVLNKLVIGDGCKITNTYILPPSRGSIMTENFIPVTGMYQKFYEGMKFLARIEENPEETSLDLQKQLADIMDGETRWNKDHYDYEMSVGGKIPLSAAASSVKELAPVEHIIKKRNIRQTSILIEEPEAHLHPLKQQMMADVLMAIFAHGASLVITSHSDYIMRRINEIIQLQAVRDKLGTEGKTKYEKLCKECGVSPELIINLSEISSYYLKRRKDGSTEVMGQDITGGIPYSTFGLALERGLSHSLKIENFLENDDD